MRRSTSWRILLASLDLGFACARAQGVAARSVKLLVGAPAGTDAAALAVKLGRLGRRLALDRLDVLCLLLERLLELSDAQLELLGRAGRTRRLGRGRLEPAELVVRLDQLEREREGPGEDERETEGAASQVKVALSVELAGFKEQEVSSRPA
jgi:hypothetical protein